MNYSLMMQKALLGVVRDILKHIQNHGLEGEHHLYINFRTDMNGVVIPTYLHQKFPEEMTIVLQYQLWDLQVFDDHFSVTLDFNSVPELIKVPFAALTKVFDPSIQFGLQFVPELHADAIEDSELRKEEFISSDAVQVNMENVIDFAKFKNRRELLHHRG